LTDARQAPAALFRCDGGARTGMGHVVRCRALAGALRAMGWRCAFAASRETVPYLAGEDVAVVEPRAAGAAQTAAAGEACGAKVLVVDHYGLDAEFEAAARGGAALVAVIDDLANRPHRCDVLLDSNPGRSTCDYESLVGSHTRLLLGLEHALLRPEFGQRRSPAALPVRERAGRLLLYLGAADPGSASERALQAVALLADPVLEATLLVGPANERRASLERAAQAVGVAVVVDPPDVAGLMLDSDMALAVASTGSLELACLGVPSLLVIAADNQRGLASALQIGGAGTLLGENDALEPASVAAAIAALAADAARRAGMRAAGRGLVDGQGAARAAAAIAGML
jgi:UDP-2,4-diacetamido-2,4,6-trideoxy-beta-L-altropyranose hydrolase